MTADATRNVVQFPGFSGDHELLRKCTGFVLSNLTPIIGFNPAALSLHSAGYWYIGDIAQSTDEQLLSIKDIGPKRLAAIKRHLATLGLTTGMKIEGWDAFSRPLRNIRSPDRPLPRYWRGRHLGLV